MVDEQRPKRQLYWTGLLKKRKKAKLEAAPSSSAKPETSATTAVDAVEEIAKDVVESPESPVVASTIAASA